MKYYSLIYKASAILHPVYWRLKCLFPHVTFSGIPMITKDREAHINIGVGTLINSRNRGYHINMHSPCKLMADKSGSQIIIGQNCRIHGTLLHAQKRILIGNRVLIAANTQIMDSNGHVISFDQPVLRLSKRDEPKVVIIGNDVWIGANAIIMKDTHIGDNVVIQAGSVVPPGSRFPSNCLVGGNPAVVLKAVSPPADKVDDLPLLSPR